MNLDELKEECDDLEEDDLRELAGYIEDILLARETDKQLEK